MGSVIQNILVVSSVLMLVACSSDENVFQGYVEGDYAYISSSVSGKLTQRLVNRGDRVSINQPLFVLDPEPETSQLVQAKYQLAQAAQQLLDLQKGARNTVIDSIEAQLKQSQVNLDFNRKTFHRYQKLYRASAIDKSSLDQAESQYKQSLQAVNNIKAELADAKLGARKNLIAAQKATVKAAQAEVKKAKWTLLQKSVKAPVASLVFDTLYEQGEFVGSGQPVVALLPPNKIKIIFFVPEDIVNYLRIGGEVIVDCDSCKNSYRAKIEFISPNAEFTPPVIFSQDSREKLVYRVEVRTLPEVANKFHPGQPVDVYITTGVRL